jgi:hypothetical protein
VSARDVVALAMLDSIGLSGASAAQGEYSADAILTALAAAGYAVVPVEPTEAMCMAGEECIVRNEGCLLAEDVYFAMLAAAGETGHERPYSRPRQNGQRAGCGRPRDCRTLHR